MTRRRHFLTAPGESLLLARSAVATATRFTAFAKDSGLPPEMILSSALCAMPLPLYVDFESHKRWPSTRPEMMWHPLMWLPSRVADRYQISDPDTGAISQEDDDLWAIRVAFELTASGLYDPEAGWVDILNEVGLDIDDPRDVQRVQRWLDGGNDPALDSIDLTEYLDIEPTTWAIESAMALRTELTEASWALAADDLIEQATALLDDVLARSQAHQDSLSRLRSISGLSEVLLGRVPAAAGQGSPREAFAHVHDMADLGAAEVTLEETSALLGSTLDLLHQVRDRYWPIFQALGSPESGEETDDLRTPLSAGSSVTD